MEILVMMMVSPPLILSDSPALTTLRAPSTSTSMEVNCGGFRKMNEMVASLSCPTLPPRGTIRNRVMEEWRSPQ